MDPLWIIVIIAVVVVASLIIPSSNEYPEPDFTDFGEPSTSLSMDEDKMPETIGTPIFDDSGGGDSGGGDFGD